MDPLPHCKQQSLEANQNHERPTEFEDALKLAGTGKFHYFLLLVNGLTIVGIITETYGVSFLLPSAQCDFNLSAADKGLLNAIYPIGMICGSHLWGYLGDTKGRKKVLVTTLLTDGLCAVLSSFSHAYWLFLIFRFACGFLTGGAGAIVFSYEGEFHSTLTRSKHILWISVFYGIGIGLQPGVAWLIIPQTWEWHLPWVVYKSWRVFIVVCALFSIIPALIILVLFPETPKFLMVCGKKEESLRVLRWMFACNTGSNPEKYPVHTLVLVEEGGSQISSSKKGFAFQHLLVSLWKQTAPIFKPPFLWKTILVCFVQYGLYASSNGLSLWLPDIFNRQAEYAALYPDSQASFCGVYEALKAHRTVANDTFSLESNSVIMHPRDVTEISTPMNGAPESNECNSEVNISIFRNTLITGGASIVSCGFLAMIIGYVGKKTILVTSLIVAGIAGCCLDVVNAGWEYLIGALIYTTLSGMCITVVVTAVVDVFPTNLRAMAVGLSLMFGRLGSFTTHMLMGVLLETNCSLTTYILGGLCTCCGLLAIFLPSPKDSSKLSLPQ